MKTVRAVVLSLLTAGAPAAHVVAADAADAGGEVETAQNLVERTDEKRSARLLEKAVERYRAVGDKALDEFNRSPEFVDKELYVYVVDSEGLMLASGGPSASLIGRNVADLKDSTGKAFFHDLLNEAKTQGRGRVEYRWENRASGRSERKLTLFEKVEDRILAVGYYRPRGTAEQAKALLARAAEALSENGKAAIDAFNRVDGGFMEDDLYVFAVDMETGRFVAHGATPALVGQNATALRDPRGKSIVPDMLNIVQRKGRGELDYAWRNPATGKVESKHSYFRTADGVLVGVGYYTR